MQPFFFKPINSNKLPRAVLFDLDGTLSDSAHDLGEALNILRRRENLPDIAFDKIRPIANHGANALIKLGFGIDENHPDHQIWRKAYLDAYAQCFDRKPLLFNNIDRMLRVLSQNNIAYGIVTNKPKKFTDALIPKLGFTIKPQVVVSGDTLPFAKPHPAPLLYAAEKIQVSPSECVYVGDALRDIEAGKSAGMQTILAAWGYIADNEKIEEWKADCIANNPFEVLSCIGLQSDFI